MAAWVAMILFAKFLLLLQLIGNYMFFKTHFEHKKEINNSNTYYMYSAYIKIGFRVKLEMLNVIQVLKI